MNGSWERNDQATTKTAETTANKNRLSIAVQRIAGFYHVVDDTGLEKACGVFMFKHRKEQRLIIAMLEVAAAGPTDLQSTWRPLSMEPASLMDGEILNQAALLMAGV